MNFDLKDIEVLGAIIEQGSFTKAATTLYRTPSAITQTIKKLELELGFVIFDRDSYRPSLTSQGRLFWERGRTILKQMQRLKHDIRFIEQGFGTEFSIAYDDLIASEKIIDLIKKFQKVAPNVTIRLHREVMNGCWDALFQNRASLAIGASHIPPEGLPCSQKELGTISWIFAISPSHPLAFIKEPISREDISQYHSIVVSDTSRQLPSSQSSGIFSGQVTIVVPSMDAKILAHVQGLGVGYLPRHRILNLLEDGCLIERKVAEKLKDKVHLKTAWRTDAYNQTMDWFLEELDKQESQNCLFEL
jgi:DNA-binding transcriptional LysR family regulator